MSNMRVKLVSIKQLSKVALNDLNSMGLIDGGLADTDVHTKFSKNDVQRVKDLVNLIPFKRGFEMFSLDDIAVNLINGHAPLNALNSASGNIYLFSEGNGGVNNIEELPYLLLHEIGHSIHRNYINLLIFLSFDFENAAVYADEVYEEFITKQAHWIHLVSGGEVSEEDCYKSLLGDMYGYQEWFADHFAFYMMNKLNLTTHIKGFAPLINKLSKIDDFNEYFEKVCKKLVLV